MSENRPHLVVLAGPNGAGKSTAAPDLLVGTLGVQEFVNADTIARGLSAFRPESTAMQAGRVMLDRLKELASQRASFAFETTLASKTFAPWITGLRQTGYEFHLMFLWLPHVEMAVSRVQDRVRTGGHDVPAETIRRRYRAGVKNFFELYQPIADTWRFYESSPLTGPRLVACGAGTQITSVDDPVAWNEVQRSVSDG